MSKIKAFISSTCFDLSQIRRDLRGYLEHVGFDVFTSESGDFPVDPFKNNVDNCLENISNADLFIILIGCRYGSTDSNGVSITNKEFLLAKSIGLPVYAFIDSSIITMIPIWKANKETKFPHVDNSAVIKFADEVRSDQWSWVHQYTSAESVIAILKEQIPVLFEKSLDLLRRNRSVGMEAVPHWIPTSCGTIIREKPRAWEYLLFSETLKAAIAENHERRLDIEFSINHGIDGMIGVDDFLKWSLYRINQIREAARSSKLIFDYLNKAGFKEFGIPGDWRNIISASKKLGHFHRFIIEWVINVKSAYIDDTESSQKLLAILSEFGMELLCQLEEYSSFVSDKLTGISERIQRGETPEMSLILSMSLSDDLVARHDKALHEWALDHGVET